MTLFLMHFWPHFFEGQLFLGFSSLGINVPFFALRILGRTWLRGATGPRKTAFPAAAGGTFLIDFFYVFDLLFPMNFCGPGWVHTGTGACPSNKNGRRLSASRRPFLRVWYQTLCLHPQMPQITILKIDQEKTTKPKNKTTNKGKNP